MSLFLISWLSDTWNLTVDAAPWLLFGFMFAGALYVFLPVDRITRHLGRPGLGSVFKAALVGIPLPLCSCSVIPVATSIRKQGASKGAFASFLISTPETGVDSIAISYALLGPFLAVIRPIAAFVTAVTAGLLISSGREVIEPVTANEVHQGEDGKEACSCADGCDSEKMTGARAKLITAVRYMTVDLFTDLAPWLVAGFLAAGLAESAIPDGFLETHVGTGFSGMLLMLVLGLPTYVCATSSTPVAAALIARGLSPGAALVFLLAGPATNMATMVVVARDLGRKGLAVYLCTIAVIAVLFGMFTDQVVTWSSVEIIQAQPCARPCGPSVLSMVSAVIFITLTANGLRMRLSRR